jgi:AcrR family transcriptional regulator
MADSKLDTQVRREQIAEAALDLVASHGVRRLSIASIARRVGLVPSGIYRHFKNKSDVIDAVLDLVEMRLRANVEAAKAETADPLERLRGMLVRHVQFIREGRGGGVPRIVFSDEVFGDQMQRKARVRQILNDYLAEIQAAVRQGQQQGRIRPDAVPETVSLMFMGMVIPAAILWHLTDGGFNVTQHAGRAWQMFRAAIAAGEPEAM